MRPRSSMFPSSRAVPRRRWRRTWWAPGTCSMPPVAGVGRFVLISTDKAVAPTSVMGSTKRVAELMVQEAASEDDGCIYTSVRFGNVLGSRGRWYPPSSARSRRSGPVTLTDPDMRRYFMTVDEAVQLVLQAAALAMGGEIFVLDMAEPV